MLWRPSVYGIVQFAPQLKRISLGGITTDNRPRWFVLGSTLLAVVALGVLGNYYHQWIIGVVAGFAIVVVSHVLYGFIQTRTRGPARPPANQHAVIVRITASKRGAPTEAEDLSTLETQLTDVIEREGLGEYDGNEVGADGATLFMYGASAEDLFKGVEDTLRASSLCRNARVQLRPGPPGTPHREIRL